MDDPVLGQKEVDVFAGTAESAALTDEEAARQARRQYREHGVPRLEPDSLVGPLLADDEVVVGLRPVSGLSRIDPVTQRAVRDSGPLYVTNRRLIHFGEFQVTQVPLADIAELAMADDRILVTTTQSGGLVLDVSGPRQMRVLLAAAKGASRG